MPVQIGINFMTMQLSWKIAWRYLFGKKSTNAIQIITGICVFGLGFGTAAIILILSVFNGFETLLLSMYDTFNPDIKVSTTKGKTFLVDSLTYTKLTSIEGIDSVSSTMEELALFEYKNRQEVGTLKGVDQGFNYVSGLDSAINRGEYLIQSDNIQYGVFGLGMAYKLGLNLNDLLTPTSIYLPNQKKSSGLLPSKQFNRSDIYTGGTFSIQQAIDYDYVIAPLALVQKLTNNEGRISAYEIKLKPGFDQNKVKNQVKEIFDEPFVIEDRVDQQASTIKVMRIEKWLAFVILILALILIAFNLVGAIWMIVLDKKKDIAVLQAMGYRQSSIRLVIIKLGVLICVLGFGIGIVLALGFYFLHKRYSLIKMGPQSIVEAYPMELYAADLPIVAAMVMLIGMLAIILPASRATSINQNQLRLS